MKKKAEHRFSALAQKPAVLAAGVLLGLILAVALAVALTGPKTTPTHETVEVRQEAGMMADMGIETILNSTALKKGFEQATKEQERVAADHFERLLADGTSPDLLRELESLEFLVQKRSSPYGSLLFVREAPERATGKGFYTIAEHGAPVLLQAPHRDEDAGTGTIVAQLMEEHDFKAAAWNTVPRWYGGVSGRVNADLAHIEVSHFNAFGLAFARVFPEGRVVQIHGFSRDKRSTASGRSASIIVSSGTSRAGAAARAIADCLASTLTAETVLLYPTQVRELGATTNTNAQALRANGFYNFVHIELSREIRDALVADPNLRTRFAKSIVQC